MRGKIVNLCIGFTNIVFGLLILVFTRIVPQDKTLITVQESTVVGYVLIGMYVLLAIIALMDFIQYFNLRRDTMFNTAYLIGVFAVSFIFIKIPVISLFSIVSGLIIVFKSLKENLVEIDSMVVISITVVLMVTSVVLGLVTFSYKSLGEKIRDKENEDELAYETSYFKYITELGSENEIYNKAYINVKKDGKYGYITEDGEVVIDFLYDYASPFVNITMYNKTFQIALVCQDGTSLIILKNGRKVMTYRSESEDDNYSAKLAELQDIYSNTLSQPGEMEFEINEITNNLSKREAYVEEPSEDYTFRYDYNEEYDLIITQSNLGLGDKFELAKKDDLDIRISLDTTDLDYDSSYLYVYSNGYIPYYEVSKEYQGWFTSYGKKREMKGKAQILEFYNDKILIRDYSKQSLYFINSAVEVLSDYYKDIYVVDEDKYIVLAENEKEKVINSNYEKIFEQEYDVINTRLIEKGLYLCEDISEELDVNDYGYVTMNFSLVNQDGTVLLDNIEQIYDLTFEIKNGSKYSKDDYNEFVEDVQDLVYEFVGDKFYTNYLEK